MGFDSGKLSQYAVKTELRRLWHRLKIGEGKAENQNNMINCLYGEVCNILDMNQDAYYSEGAKLPLILPQFMGRAQVSPLAVAEMGTSVEVTRSRCQPRPWTRADPEGAEC